MAALILNLGTEWGDWLGSRPDSFGFDARPAGVY